MQRTILIALHGFLGSHQDFNFLLKLKKKYPELLIYTPDLLSIGEENSPDHDTKEGLNKSLEKTPAELMNPPVFSAAKSIIDAANEVLNFIEGLLKLDSSSYPDQAATKPRIFLLGYSLGARILWQAYQQRPDLFTFALLVSTHPFLFLQTKEARAERLAKDQEWAEKLLSLENERFFREWNNQEVLKRGPHPERKTFSRAEKQGLALMLTNWSQSRSAYERPFVGTALDAEGNGQANPANSRFLFLIGEDDVKYKNLFLKHNGEFGFPCKFIVNQGHRLIFSDKGQEEVLNLIESRMF